MLDEKLKQLGASLFGQRAENEEVAQKPPATPFKIPKLLHEVIASIGGPVFFDNGAIFKPSESCPLCDSDGYLRLGLIFGFGSGKHGIQHQRERYEGEIPESLLPIGDAPGGNLICINSEHQVYLWDHESDRDEEVYLVASSMESFFDSLEPDIGDIGDTSGIIESESPLDF